ncbi:MAG TPA: hypothetical protein VFT99_12140 [Roseiflexaceae bacterium]|nr:hypothetical protein [Roseiflexaceae bacterium]
MPTSNFDFVGGMLMGPALIANAQRSGTPERIFDWHKAAQRIKETGARSAEAGLDGDWNYTGGTIWRDGAIVPRDETYTYLASLWAEPMLILDDFPPEPCWLPRSETEWDAGTYWPDSARAILAEP